MFTSSKCVLMYNVIPDKVRREHRGISIKMNDNKEISCQ